MIRGACDDPSEMPDDLTHEYWYELYHVLIDNVYGMPCLNGLQLVEVYEVIGVNLHEEGMHVDVRRLYRGPDGEEVIFESCGGVLVTDYMRAGGTIAELVEFVATLSKLAPVADQVDAAEEAKARSAKAALDGKATASPTDAGGDDDGCCGGGSGTCGGTRNGAGCGIYGGSRSGCGGGSGSGDASGSSSLAVAPNPRRRLQQCRQRWHLRCLWRVRQRLHLHGQRLRRRKLRLLAASGRQRRPEALRVARNSPRMRS